MSKLRHLLSSNWEWIKLSPRVHLHRESKMAAVQSTDFSESVAVILDEDAERTLKKCFDKTIIKKGYVVVMLPKR